MIYSGFIDCGGSEADYEFESDEILDGMGQLNFLLNTGILQIMNSAPRSDDEEDDEEDY